MVTGNTEAEPPTTPASAQERSRRSLLSGGAVLGVSALVAGCTSKVKQPSNVPLNSHTKGAARDVELLNRLLGLEYRSIAAYTACIPLLPQPPKPPPGAKKPPPPPPPNPNIPPPPLQLRVPLSSSAAQQFLTEELAHVTELAGFVGQAGGHAVKPAPSYALGHPKGKLEVLTLLHQTEEMLLSEYLKAISELTPSALRGAAAAIFANHAEHTSILRMELGLKPIPGAFVSGPE